MLDGEGQVICPQKFSTSFQLHSSLKMMMNCTTVKNGLVELRHRDTRPSAAISNSARHHRHYEDDIAPYV